MISFFRISAVLCSFIFFFQNNYAQNSVAYEQRRTAYINTALSNFNGDAITIQAYQGVPVNLPSLYALTSTITTKSTVDFDIVKLVRVLCLSSGQYDTIILPALNSIPFWLTKSDTLRGYWSENHMIQWMSSDWLLHERYNKTVDANLDYRLRHYLRMKVKYGFYEFFSSTYAPYCLSGLLNLADFAQDTEIKTLATQAAQRLLADTLLPGAIITASTKLPTDKTTTTLFICLPVWATPRGAPHTQVVFWLLLLFL
jgi:hypothetical protein